MLSTFAMSSCISSGESELRSILVPREHWQFSPGDIETGEDSRRRLCGIESEGYCTPRCNLHLALEVDTDRSKKCRRTSNCTRNGISNSRIVERTTISN